MNSENLTLETGKMINLRRSQMQAISLILIHILLVIQTGTYIAVCVASSSSRELNVQSHAVKVGLLKKWAVSKKTECGNHKGRWHRES